jgi:hypothetical protein
MLSTHGGGLVGEHVTLRWELPYSITNQVQGLRKQRLKSREPENIVT